MKQRFAADFSFGGAQAGEFLANFLKFFAFFELDQLFEKKKIILVIQSL